MDKSSTHAPERMLRFSKSWSIFSKYAFFVHRLFYKSIVVEGFENIPRNVPTIFAPNHQNALMDPMLIIATARQQVVFLARADIFKNKFIAHILMWLKILPVYRIRDGKNNLEKNDESFHQVIEVLEHKLAIGIFPEAQHSDKRHLLALKKGIPRLAFEAEEKNNFNLHIQVIPVGIYYSRYNIFRTIAHVRYGKPIDVTQFKEIYLENEQKGFQALRDAIAAQLEQLAINIRNLQLYDMYESIRALYVKQLIKKFRLGKLTQINRFKADKITIAFLDRYAEDHPEAMEQLREKVAEYEELKRKYSLSDQSIEKPKLKMWRLVASVILLLACLPVFLYGLLNNSIVYFVPKLLVLKIKDKQFHSSVKFGWGVIIGPILYLLQSVVFLLITGSWLYAALYLVSLPVTGFAAQAYFEWDSIIMQDFRKWKLRNLNTETYIQIIKTHKDIIHKLNIISNKYK
ncbi:MAG TPA: lysophospholipid acyltransferase family protein [Bacteroidales bacterium]|nr:lysophospholipid acyltransferase family protein [Bacteroidales bacterium]